MTILAFLFGIVITFFALGVVAHYPQSKNKVHFYVARDSNNELGLWFGKPYRGIENWVCVGYSVLIADGDNDLNLLGLKLKDFQNLKWEDEPVEVFLNCDNL